MTEPGFDPKDHLLKDSASIMALPPTMNGNSTFDKYWLK